MNVTIVNNKEMNGNSIILECAETDHRINRIKDYAEIIDNTIRCKMGEIECDVELQDIFYIEALERKTFIYSENDVLESNVPLYIIEERISGYTFVRISKGCMINLMKVVSIEPMINRNLYVTLKNREKVIVSRRYVKGFREKLRME